MINIIDSNMNTPVTFCFFNLFFIGILMFSLLLYIFSASFCISFMRRFVASNYFVEVRADKVSRCLFCTNSWINRCKELREGREKSESNANVLASTFLNACIMLKHDETIQKDTKIIKNVTKTQQESKSSKEK